MRELKILKAIEEYSAAAPARLHMPGHKAEGDFSSKFPVAGIDVTELSFSGCLTSGEGVIREAEEVVAGVLGCVRSHMVTDGSSAAILSMMYALSKRGKKVIIPRFSHKSVYNGLKLFGLEPLFLPVEQRDGIYLQPTDCIEGLLLENPDCAGVMLTSPDYYGIVPDLAAARRAVDKAGKLLLIDGAHGGHMRFTCGELYAGKYAHAWVDGVHKTLPCLTQAALLNVNDRGVEEDVLEGLSIFRTTSPSYPIMASIEYGVYRAEELTLGGCEVLGWIRELKQRLSEQGCVFLPVQDEMKIVLDCFAGGMDCLRLDEYLQEDGVYGEMFDGRYAVFMASVCTDRQALERLYKGIENYRKTNLPTQIAQKQGVCELSAVRAADYCVAVSAPSETVSALSAIGRICAENCGFFPPCFPIITAGEVFTEEIIKALEGGGSVYGTDGRSFKVVKE